MKPINSEEAEQPMRLGGPVRTVVDDPDRWAAEVRRRGYGAAPFPLEVTAGKSDPQAYVAAARVADIVIAEVGAWSNPLSPDEMTRRAALTLCQERLALADEVGACCCVNIAGSRGQRWDGPHPDNLTTDTFDLIVETVRSIIDAVKPTRTFYTLETMPWMYPDSVDSYHKLIQAIDRPRFAVHLDPVNLVCSPQRYYSNAVLIRECFARLGPHVRSCHAKDIRLSEELTVHLDEVRPGLGGLDYAAYLTELNRLDPDTPLILEHLESEEDYALAAGHIRDVASQIQVALL
jgi:sugar phosphate isomerase/epimerase